MILHTVNKSPFHHDALRTCLRAADAGDGILLIEDGVYAALAGTLTAPLLGEALALCAVYVLLPDATARGIAGRLVDGVTAVDYAGFVELTARHRSVVSWF